LFEGFPVRRAVFTFARKIFLIGVVACSVLPAAALAADPESDAAIKSKNVEASVFLDHKIKEDAALVAFVPWETLKPYLTPEGLRIFGGERAKADDDDQQ
jgi:hypothetical protein